MSYVQQVMNEIATSEYIAKLEAENSRLKDALIEIIQQAAPAIAKKAIKGGEW